jgi:hypothetical protein
MDTTKLSSISKSDGAAQASAHLKSIRPCRGIHVRLVQNVLLTDCSDTVNQIQQVVNDISTFTDPDRCIDFVRNSYSGHVCMILSDTLCEKVVPLIHDVVQLQTIFILCKNKTKYEQ